MIVDIRIEFDDNKDAEALEVNSGVSLVKEPKYIDGIYETGVFIPKTDWRSLTDDEHKLIIGEVTDRSEGKTNLIGSIPESMLNQFYTLYLEHINDENVHLQQPILNDKVKPTFIDTVEHFFKEALGPFELVSSVFQVTNKQAARKQFPSNTDISDYSTTQSPNSGYGLRGVHCDNWGRPRLPIDERCKAGIKIGINFGLEERYVTYSNLSLQAIKKLLIEKGEVEEKFLNHDFATPLVESFLLQFDSYPLVKVRIRPGQFYLMPVQNMIHDGYPYKNQLSDVNLMLSIEGLVLGQQVINATPE